MDYRKLIESENTDDRFSDWSEYRHDLTTYIIECIVSVNAKKKLNIEKKRRLKQEVSIDSVVADYKVEHGSKPTLAIWGAGGCNDIDIAKLSKYFKLVLIDDNIDKVSETRDRYGFDNEDCSCIDLSFWKIRESEYVMFDALLKDKAPIDDLVTFFEEMENEADEFDYDNIPRFDYSVAVGLASQLCSRLAAILHINNMNSHLDEGYVGVIGKLISKLNQSAVDRLYNAINLTTKDGIIVGYEAYTFDETKNYEGLASYCDDIIDNFHMHFFEGDQESDIWLDDIYIEGSSQMETYIMNRALENKINIIGSNLLFWPFSEAKQYATLVRCIDKL